MTPLASDAVNELALETGVFALFAEFLGDFFDGAPHAVGQNAAVPFPKAVIRFQQSALPQPLNGAGISMTWNSPTLVTKKWDNGGQEVATTLARWNFWIRSELADPGDAAALCMDTAQKLFALLANSGATQPLAQKGIHRLRPMTPSLVTDTGYVLRLMPCTAQLRWLVQSQK